MLTISIFPEAFNDFANVRSIMDGAFQRYSQRSLAFRLGLDAELEDDFEGLAQSIKVPPASLCAVHELDFSGCTYNQLPSHTSGRQAVTMKGLGK